MNGMTKAVWLRPIQAVSKHTPGISVVTPGILAAVAIAETAYLTEPWVKKFLPIPAVVIALLIGIVLHPVTPIREVQAGLVFCVKKLLRWAVALLGLRIALSDIADLGLHTAVLVVAAMAITLASGMIMARLLRNPLASGALSGAATAVCGASAALATSAVLPAYKGKDTDTVFVVIAVNLLSTLAMVTYPALGHFLGFDDKTNGVFLGATIHDVAQVVGAGYSVSETAGNTAVIVKLFRVFLLMPVVLSIGSYFATKDAAQPEAAGSKIPRFAIAFFLLCIVNSIPMAEPIAGLYAQIKALLVQASAWGLLIAISALGLSTSFASIVDVGWRQLVTVTVATLVILAVAAATLLSMS